jgi:ferredoxin
VRDNPSRQFGFRGMISPNRRETMKVVVNYDLCESNARCMEVAGEVFEVRADDRLYILKENPPESLRAKVEKAVRVCPKQAISIVED